MNKFDPDNHHRRSIRLKDYDYTLQNAYFVTICTHEKYPWFGKITDGIMELNKYGTIAKEAWLDIPNHRPYIILHEFVVMPNHFHGIVEIKRDKPDELCLTPPIKTGNNMIDILPKPASLSTIIGSYKSAVTKAINQTGVTFSWQKGFYEHIIRNNDDYMNIAGYIELNPANWTKDDYCSDTDNRVQQCRDAACHVQNQSGVASRIPTN